MPAPSQDWTMVTVHGTYTRLDGSPAFGQVVFTPRAGNFSATSALTNVIGRAIVAYLDGTGSFSQQLPATDDPDVIPTNFTYRVREMFTGGRDYDIVVPSASAGTGIDLASVSPIDPDEGTTPPSGVGIVADDPALTGITMRAGYTLPSAAANPNTIYFIIPTT